MNHCMECGKPFAKQSDRTEKEKRCETTQTKRYKWPMNEKQTNISEGGKMLTVQEYASMTGRARKTVQKWCLYGMLEGVEKIQSGARFRYIIPRDAKPHKRKPEKPQEPPKPKKVWTEREISLHIMRYCGTRTYQQLSNELGMSVAEVRSRYDRLHEIHGV